MSIRSVAGSPSADTILRSSALDQPKSPAEEDLSLQAGAEAASRADRLPALEQLREERMMRASPSNGPEKDTAKARCSGRSRPSGPKEDRKMPLHEKGFLDWILPASETSEAGSHRGNPQGEKGPMRASSSRQSERRDEQVDLATLRRTILPRLVADFEYRGAVRAKANSIMTSAHTVQRALLGLQLQLFCIRADYAHYSPLLDPQPGSVFLNSDVYVDLCCGNTAFYQGAIRLFFAELRHPFELDPKWGYTAPEPCKSLMRAIVRICDLLGTRLQSISEQAPRLSQSFQKTARASRLSITPQVLTTHDLTPEDIDILQNILQQSAETLWTGPLASGLAKCPKAHRKQLLTMLVDQCISHLEALYGFIYVLDGSLQLDSPEFSKMTLQTFVAGYRRLLLARGATDTPPAPESSSAKPQVSESSGEHPG